MQIPVLLWVLNSSCLLLSNAVCCIYELPQAGSNHIHLFLYFLHSQPQMQFLAHSGYLTHLFNVQ